MSLFLLVFCGSLVTLAHRVRTPRAFAAMVALALIPIRVEAQPRVLTNLWSFLLYYPCDSSPAIGEDGTVYFGLWNGDFRAFSPEGTPKWVFHAGREIKSSPAIGSEGSLYFGSRDGKLYALRPDGRKMWDFKTGAWVDSSPAIGADGSIYFGSWDKNFYALNPDGSVKWRFQTAGEIVSSPAIGADERIYFGSHDHNFYALTPAGQKAWQFPTGGPILSSPALDKDGTVYFTSVDGFLYAVQAQGALKWKLKTGGITESSPVIGRDGTIYVGANQALWAISPAGKKEWDLVYSPDLIEAAPLALDDGSVCFVSRLGVLVNLTAPGQLNWIYDQKWFGVSPTVGRGGLLYTMGNIIGKGILFCALETESKLAPSPWPKFRADIHNTGRLKMQSL